MARKARFLPVGLPQHIIQRGNNRRSVLVAKNIVRLIFTD
jgi:REP element-mobilizing transposase RayT